MLPKANDPRKKTISQIFHQNRIQKVLMKIKEMADVFLNSANFCDLSFASTETKFIKPKTKTQNNVVIFGFFHKKNYIIILAFFEII